MTVPTHITSTLLIFLLLCSALLATTLQGVQGEVEVEGPSESECRPYIEKALKQLEIGDTPTERSEEALKSDEDSENKSEGSIEKTDVDELTSVEETLQEGTSKGTDSVEIENETEDEGTNEQNDTKEVDESGDTQSKEEITESAEAKSGEQEEKETSKEGEEQQSKEDVGSSERPDEAEKSAEQDESPEETPGSDEGKPTSTEDGSPSAEDIATVDAASSEVKVETDSKEVDATEETAKESAEEATATEEAESAEQGDDTKERTSTETTSSAEDTVAQSEEKTVDTSAETADTEEVKDDEKSAENIESVEKEESAEGEAATASAEETGASEATETEDSAADEAVDSVLSEEDKEAKESDETGDSGARDTADSRGDETEDSAAAETKESAEDTSVSAETEAKESDETETAQSTEAAESAEETVQSAETDSEKSGESAEKEAGASAEVEARASSEVEAGASAEVEAGASSEVEAGASAEVEAGASAEVEAGASAEAEASTESAEKTEGAEEGAAESTEVKEASEETANVETEEAASEEKELVPEEELIEDIEIPTNLRSRDHINQILQLNEESTEVENLLTKAADITLRELKRLYENAIKPLEVLYKYRDLSNRHFGDSEIFSKPLVLFMGPWSGGKSSIINYLLDNEYSHTSLRTGAEPSPAYFNILMWGEEPEILDGTQMAPDFTFSGLQKFGQGLEERLRGHKLPSKLLEKINIVEIPGILEVRKQVSRVFPFNDACQWFIDRADIIFLVYDPSKLDVGPETEAILDQLKGREYQTRIILNKADQVKPEELMRVQGALIWNISPLMSSAQPPVMYTTSLWSRPYEPTAPVRLLQAQEKAFLRDLKSAVDKRIENKIASARRFAVRVRNHAKMVDCYLTTYYNHKSVFGNKKLISDQIIEHPQDYHIYEGLSTLTNISRYDLPDPDVYRDFFRLNPLYDFQQLSATCTYFRGCPINRLDMAIAYDLPELVGKYKKMVESALSSVPDSEAKS